jgi:hypothetical protein
MRSLITIISLLLFFDLALNDGGELKELVHYAELR